jgi:hypothetical protein
MYGLMKARTCAMTAEQKRLRRLRYCGTCKTLGRSYGAASRMLLNHDAVFLGELLMALSAREPKWARAYQSYNCFSLPGESDEMPLALQFAAASNILLAEFKVADQINDSSARRWRIARRVLRRPFRQASAQLAAWRFPLEELWPLLDEQDRREAAPQPTLDYLAEPTARATALFFRHGAAVAELEAATQETMAQLGRAFGRLVYTLDALEDYAKDAQRNEFNALRAVYGWAEKRLNAAQHNRAANEIRRIGDEIAALLDALPLDGATREGFAARLRGNLRGNLTRGLPLLAQTQHACSHTREAFAQRWARAKKLSGKLAAQNLTSWCGYLKYPLVFATVALAALVWPQQAAQARSWRECLDFNFNLMFLGAAVGMVLARPRAVLTSPEEKLAERARRGQPQGDGGDAGADAAECCCDCCSEGCCDCDSCYGCGNPGSGCCDNCHGCGCNCGDGCNCCDGCSCCD